jgi:hypothetical protein
MPQFNDRYRMPQRRQEKERENAGTRKEITSNIGRNGKCEEMIVPQ